jgi:hypothetical protein
LGDHSTNRLCFLSKILYEICTIIDLNMGAATNQAPKEPLKSQAPTNIRGGFKWITSPRASFLGFPCSNVMRRARLTQIGFIIIQIGEEWGGGILTSDELCSVDDGYSSGDCELGSNRDREIKQLKGQHSK